MRQYFVRMCFGVGLVTLTGSISEVAPPAAISSSSPDIWLKGGARLVNIPPAWVGFREDTGEMWEPNAPWSAVASHVSVVEFPPGNVEWAADKDLQTAFLDMKRRNIALALEAGLLTQSEHCPIATEASSKPGVLQKIVEKIRRNGGDLHYIAMDEPYSWGHAAACHETAAELARNVAANVMTVRSIFPNVKIGDIEVVGASSAWVDELAEWTDAYRAAVGENLEFLQTDINWSDLAMHALRPLSEALNARGIPLAVIYNADADATTDESWARSTERHISEIEGPLGIRPAMAVFSTWVPHPSRVLPETRPWTLTNLVLRYLRPASAMQLSNTGASVSGHLTGSRGEPIARADVVIAAVDVGARTKPSQRSFTGVVPTDAADAVIGIRIDSEGACICAGVATVTLGDIHYQEKDGGKRQDVPPGAVTTPASPGALRTMVLEPGQHLAPNLRQLSVSPGKAYTLDVEMAATANAEQAGYVTIVWLDSRGNGIKREKIWFSPSQWNLPAVTTDSNGDFFVNLPETIEAAHPEIRAYYLGDSAVKPAMAILQ